MTWAMDGGKRKACQATYDLVADEYVRRIFEELGHKPLDRELLDRFAASVRDVGPACDMMALGTPDDTWAGIAAFYSIIHIPRDDLARALGELRRVLRPGGILLLAFHIGDEIVHLDEWWGQKVSVDFFLHRSDEMAAFLRAAGFEIDEVIEREPYPDVEHQSRRSYIFARRPRGLHGDA